MVFYLQLMLLLIPSSQTENPREVLNVTRLASLEILMSIYNKKTAGGLSHILKLALAVKVYHAGINIILT